MSLYEKYLKQLGDPHNIRLGFPSLNFLDFHLREAIGKTDDIRVAMCSHNAIINREFPEHFCRVCHRNLNTKRGVGRVNDYLVLRHKQCQKPICLDCSKNNPDKFYLAFKRGVDKYMQMRKILR